MRMATTVLAITLGAAVSGCVTTVPAEELARATLRSPAGAEIGTATVTSTTLNLSVTGLTPGVHGVHLHAVGQCQAPDFSSAGPHLNPASTAHGFRNPAGHHLGDLPNLTADARGRGQLRAALAPSTRESFMVHLFDGDGTAIVVHAGPDDLVTDPSGNSGGRVACGAFVRG